MGKIMSILSDLRPECDFSASSDFLTDGLLDSFDIVALVSALQDEFSISIDGRDIVAENFNSLAAIAALVAKAGGRV